MFHRVRMNLRITSSRFSGPKRRGNQGELDVNRYQRSASAPCLSRMLQGSTTLPRRLDILRPSLSRMWPRTEHVAIAGVTGQQGADGEQAVEPAAGLVDGFADEVGWEALLATAPGSRRDSATAPPAWSRSRTRRR